MRRLPSARRSDLLTQEIGNEIIVYDLRSNRAFCLNETAATVWSQCDGKTPVKMLRQNHNFSENLVCLAIDELQESGLIRDKIKTDVPSDKLKRRRFLTEIAAMSAVALPLICTLIAPRASFAQSCMTNVFGVASMLPDTPQPDFPSCVAYCQTESMSACCGANAVTAVLNAGICNCIDYTCA